MNRSDSSPAPRGKRQLVFMEPVPQPLPGESDEEWSKRAAEKLYPVIKAHLDRARALDAKDEGRDYGDDPKAV